MPGSPAARVEAAVAMSTPGGRFDSVRPRIMASSSPEERWRSLVARMARGDEASLAELYDDTSAAVHGLVLHILRDRADAEEITLDVYVQAWSQAKRFDAARGTVSAWLLTLARTRAIDRLRSRRGSGASARPHEVSLDAAAGAESPGAGPLDASAFGEKRARLRAAFGALNPSEREAVSLAYYFGLTHSEIADRLDLPLGTVKTRIRSALKKLRVGLENCEVPS